MEQSASMALAASHRGDAMETGRTALAGTAQDLPRDPQVRDAYLGRRTAGRRRRAQDSHGV